MVPMQRACHVERRGFHAQGLEDPLLHRCVIRGPKLTILYEIHDVTRFDRVQECASYARLVKCVHQSAGKKLGTGGAQMGNVHPKWAFSEAAVLFLRHTKDGKKILAGIEKKHGKGKALSILAHKIGRAVFYMLSRGTVFSLERFRAA